MAQTEIALRVPGMHEAVANENVAYDRRRRLDVYRPPGSLPEARFAAVLLVHGRTDDPSPKDWGIYLGWGQLLAAHGLAGIPFNHRGDAADVRAALAAVRERAGELGVDGDRLGLASSSAGVPWGMEVALSDDRLRCALAFYGPPDAALARAGAPPTFLAKAALDEPWINEAIDAYAARATELGADVRVVAHESGLHGFDARNHDARSREILRDAIGFAREHLDSSPA